MKSENQIWGLIWSSLQEVSLQGSHGRMVASGGGEQKNPQSRAGEPHVVGVDFTVKLNRPPPAPLNESCTFVSSVCPLVVGGGAACVHRLGWAGGQFTSDQVILSLCLPPPPWRRRVWNKGVF